MAETLADMKVRIADELARDDLTNQIGYAVSDAIQAYNNERFYFNETRNIVFNTVADQEFYDSADNEKLGRILEIDYVFLNVGGNAFRIDAEFPEEIESLSNAAMMKGQPSSYCWYQEQLRLYPIPTSPAWTVRIGAALQIAAPQTDDEANNPWMLAAAQLIRARAKYEIGLHVTLDPLLVTAMGGGMLDSDGNPIGGAIGQALKTLRQQTVSKTKVGGGRVRSMAF